MPDGVVDKKDEYEELRDIASRFQKLADDGLSREDIEAARSSGIYHFTSAQMARRFNI